MEQGGDSSIASYAPARIAFSILSLLTVLERSILGFVCISKAVNLYLDSLVEPQLCEALSHVPFAGLAREEV